MNNERIIGQEKNNNHCCAILIQIQGRQNSTTMEKRVSTFNEMSPSHCNCIGKQGIEDDDSSSTFPFTAAQKSISLTGKIYTSRPTEVMVDNVSVFVNTVCWSEYRLSRSTFKNLNFQIIVTKTKMFMLAFFSLTLNISGKNF